MSISKIIKNATTMMPRPMATLPSVAFRPITPQITPAVPAQKARKPSINRCSGIHHQGWVSERNMKTHPIMQ